MTSPDDFFFFFKFWFSGVLGKGEDKRQKMALNDKKNVSLHISGAVSNCGFWYTCVKWWYLQYFLLLLLLFFVFFSFFRNSDFLGFSKFINKCQKEILRCAPFLICVWFLDLHLSSFSWCLMDFFSLVKEINRLISKWMTNIYLKCTAEKNWLSQKTDVFKTSISKFKTLVYMSVFEELSITETSLNFKTFCCYIKIRGLWAKTCVAFQLF